MGELKNIMTEMFSEHYLTYQKIKYISAIIILCGIGLFKLNDDKSLIMFAIVAIVLIYLANEIISKFDDRININAIIVIKFIELSIYNTLDYLFPMNGIAMSLWTVLIVSAGISFIVDSSDLDKTTVFIRKILYFIPIAIKVLFTMTKNSEAEWFCCCLLQGIISVIIFSVVDAYLHLNDTYENIKRTLTIEKSTIESNNEKLLDYQERVKTINEQINYQKIDLARTLRELEQVNIETESQTEIMKFMVSTFDILKCINVITDSIMEVKKTKLCAMYIDKGVYQNKESSCIVKTNYTSMHRRLKKDIDTIYQSISCNLNSSNRIITGASLKDYRFIGDANINSLAFLPIMDRKKIFGLMILGSDDSDFFDSGTNYYESCIVEFNAALKSTNLYLQMEDMARKDGLTGIYNRVYNTELFKKVSKDAISRKKPLTVALFDIDKFKSVNDTYGHLAGDDVIKMVAGVAQKYAQKYNGFACRFGGEEFLLTLPDYDIDESIVILEAMHEEIKTTTVDFGDYEIKVNVCIGVSSYPNLCENPEILVSRADKAMYYGKKNGRGRLVIDNPEIDLN